MFTTFVDGIAYPGRVTFWLISKYAYCGNVTVDGLSGIDLLDVRSRNDELKSALYIPRYATWYYSFTVVSYNVRGDKLPRDTLRSIAPELALGTRGASRT